MTHGHVDIEIPATNIDREWLDAMIRDHGWDQLWGTFPDGATRLLYPYRVQLRRVNGWRKPANTIVVARPSRWGNPYTPELLELTVGGIQLGMCVGEYDRGKPMHMDIHMAQWKVTTQMTVDLYREDLEASLAEPSPDWDHIRDGLAELRGHHLACWCPLNSPCHADVLLDLANQQT